MARMMQRGDQSSIGQEGKTAVAAAGKGGDRCSGKRVWNRYGVVEDWRDLATVTKTGGEWPKKTIVEIGETVLNQ